MHADEAIKLVKELVRSEVELMKQFSNKGVTTKKADRDERNACRKLFLALTGQEPTEAQSVEMVNL